MYKNTLYIILFLSLLIPSSCVEPYPLPDGGADAQILVINGYLDIDKQACTITLTYTQNLDDRNAATREVNAQVSLESEHNEFYSLRANGFGVYSIDNLPVELGRNYRLRIRTEEGNEYLSAFVNTHKTPPIDNLSWRVQDGAIHLEVSTHDPQNNTRYYLWKVEETWQYNSYVVSYFTMIGDTPTPRSTMLTTCWKTERPSNIFIGTSEQLAQDVIYKHELIRRLGNSQRFNQRYSYLVTQFAISREEFNYWRMIKKNTENVGTLFDPQPSQVSGNFTCLNKPGTTVLGYFSVRSSQEKRLFIGWEDLLQWKFRWVAPTCSIDTATMDDLDEVDFGAYDLVDEIKGVGYTYAHRACIDCRSQGGTLIKPDFWQE